MYKCYNIVEQLFNCLIKEVKAMETKMIKFKGICCANCASKIERKLNKIKGVSANVSYVTGKILFELEDSLLYDKCIELIKKEEPDFMVIE